jgi:hypothetical protein
MSFILPAGSQGIVYEGVWQGATVAVKWSIADQLDTGAYELLFSRLLSHPNVVQTYDAKVAVLDAEVCGVSLLAIPLPWQGLCLAGGVFSTGRVYVWQEVYSRLAGIQYLEHAGVGCNLYVPFMAC